MTVLICIPCLLCGGTEMQTLNLAQALLTRGHKVAVLCYFEYLPEVLAQFNDIGSQVICLSPSGKRIRGFRMIKHLYKGINNAINEVKPQVVHVQYMTPGAIPILLLRLLGIDNIITTIHTTADIYSNLHIVHFIQRYCVRSFNCVTKTAEQSFFHNTNLYTTDIQLQKRNHFTLYNCLSQAIDPIKTPRKDRPITTIGFVGRLERIKGADLVIPAFASGCKENRQLRLLIVGDGSLRSFMQEQAQQLQVADRIEWAGRQQQSQLQAYYDRIDLLLIPSRSEGFGLTALEGMARGCIVLAAQVGGLCELIEEERSGLLHIPEDVDDMVRCIKRVVGNQKLRNYFAERAVLRARQFDFEQYSTLVNSLHCKFI